MSKGRDVPVTLTYVRRELGKRSPTGEVTTDVAKRYTMRVGFPRPLFGAKQMEAYGHAHKMWYKRKVDDYIARHGYHPEPLESYVRRVDALRRALRQQRYQAED